VEKPLDGRLDIILVGVSAVDGDESVSKFVGCELVRENLLEI
jgi:hypothetical protein